MVSLRSQAPIRLDFLLRNNYAYYHAAYIQRETRSVSWLDQPMNISSTGKRLEKRLSHVYAICSASTRATRLATRYVQPSTCAPSSRPKVSPAKSWDRPRIAAPSSPGSREMDRRLHSC